MTKQVTINGQELPIKYGFAALMSFTEATGKKLKDLESLGEDISLADAVTLIWAGLKQGARSEKQAFAMTIEDVADLLDENQDLLNAALEIFAQSFGVTEGK